MLSFFVFGLTIFPLMLMTFASAAWFNCSSIKLWKLSMKFFPFNLILVSSWTDKDLELNKIASAAWF